ncbi:MAG TPA: hypothetical protein PLM75_05670, partial [bacterium]|nr:hypothetical protein [bacterium]
SNDVIKSNYQTFHNFIELFINFCENDEIVKIITLQFKNNQNINLENWYKDFLSTGGSFIGSKRFWLPKDDEDRLALYYKFIFAIANKKISLVDFCVHAFGKTNGNEMILVFNEQFFLKFIREIKYKLEEFFIDSEGIETIDLDRLFIFNHYDKQIIISNISNSNIAVDNSSISISSKPLNDYGSLITEIRKLIDEKIYNELDKTEKEKLNTIFDNPKSADKIEVVNVFNTLLKKIPDLKNGLKKIIESTSVELLSSGIIEGIKFLIN